MNTTTTLPAEAATPAVDYSPIHRIVDRVIGAEGTESREWLALFDACESADDPREAWNAAREHYVSTYPTGKRGKATRPADTFKSRKSDVNVVRKAHPRMSADAIVAAYGSVRAAAGAIRRAARTEPTEPTTPTAVTLDERLAAITAAVRLAVADGATAEQIAAAVAAATTDPLAGL